MRGQLTGRLLVIIFSWVGLIAILLLGLLFSKFGGNPATPSASGVSAPFLEVSLHAYLYRTIDSYGYGNNVPFVEFLAGELLQDRKDDVEKSTKQFLSLLPSSKLAEIYIYVDNQVVDAKNQPGILSWVHEGSDVGGYVAGPAVSSFVLPDGRKVRVEYYERDA